MPEYYLEDTNKSTKISTSESEKGYDQELEERLTKQIAKGAGITFTGSVFGKGINYVSQIIIARLLGAGGFGLYILGRSIFSLVQLLSQMGFQVGSVRYISQYKGEKDYRRIKGTIIQSLSFPFVMGIGLGIILFFSSGSIAVSIFHEAKLTGVIRVFSLGIPFMASMMVAAFATRGFQKTQYFVYVKNLFHPIINLLLIGLMYWFGFRLYGAISAWVISGVLGLFLASYFLIRQFPAIRNTKAIFNLKELLSFSTPSMLVMLLGFLLMWTDTFILGYFRPAREIGLYRAAAQTALLLTVTLGAFKSIFGPIISELHSKGSFETLNTLYKIVTRWTVYLSVPLLIVLITSAKDVLNIFGPAFARAWTPLIILSFSHFINCSMGTASQILLMSGNQMIEFYNSIGIVTLNIILNLLLIPRLGLVGAALATSTAIVGLSIVRLYEVKYILGLWPYERKYIKGLAAGAVAGISVVVLRAFLPDYHYLLVLVTSASATLGVFTAMLFTLGFDQEDRKIIAAVKKKIIGNLRTEI